MNRDASPFSTRAILGMLAVGMAAFVLLLYAIGAGWNGRDDHDGGAHAAANGVNGFAGLAQLLEARGYDVSLSRDSARLDGEGLLILTPQLFADGEAIGEIVEARRYIGPTLLVLPKWFAGRVDRIATLDAPKGWVVLSGAVAPEWLDEVVGVEGTEAKIGERKRWEGMGLTGTLPESESGLALVSASLSTPDWTSVLPLVTDEKGDVLAGFLNDDGSYPMLDDAAGYGPGDEVDETLWPVVIVAEPDLMNNYGLADRDRARLALTIVAASLDDYDIPIVFDLTLAGLGQGENLLTLAFRPPFLAATLCLLLAALVIGWRAMRRFGPPVAEAPALAMGKRQLARNGAALVERAKRLHLLGPPYAALVTRRIAAALGVREADPRAREDAVARQLDARGVAADFAQRAETLRQARTPHELLRAAGALRTIERTLAR